MNQINVLSFIGAAESRQGGREENQDAFVYAETPAGLLVIVCDGMGGGPAGRYASSLASHTIVEYISKCQPDEDGSRILAEAIRTAHMTLKQHAAENSALRGMGTTVTALLVNDYSAVVAHVGDSRVYQLRRGRKKFRTFDHSMVFELVRNKSLTEEQARLSADSNIITQALGIKGDINVETKELAYEKGDRFMLCTDGIWGMLPEKELIRKATQTPSVNGTVGGLAMAIDQIGISQGGHHDNLTVAIIEMTKDSKYKEDMDRKTRFILISLAVLLLICVAGIFVQQGVAKKQRNEIKKLEERVSLLTEQLQRLQNTDESNAALIETLKEKNEQLETDNSKLEKNNEQLKQQAASQSDRAEVVEEIDAIIKQLDIWKSKKRSADKDKAVEAIKKDVEALREELEGRYGLTEKDWQDSKGNNITKLLSDSIMKKDDSNDKNEKVKGHYNIVIGILKNIKGKINK